MLYEMLSRQARIVLNVLSVITVLAIVYYFFLGRGPAFFIADWTSRTLGFYSFSASLLLAFLPLVVVEWLLVFAVDRLIQRRAE